MLTSHHRGVILLPCLDQRAIKYITASLIANIREGKMAVLSNATLSRVSVDGGKTWSLDGFSISISPDCDVKKGCNPYTIIGEPRKEVRIVRTEDKKDHGDIFVCLTTQLESFAVPEDYWFLFRSDRASKSGAIFIPAGQSNDIICLFQDDCSTRGIFVAEWGNVFKIELADGGVRYYELSQTQGLLIFFEYPDPVNGWRVLK